MNKVKHDALHLGSNSESESKDENKLLKPFERGSVTQSVYYTKSTLRPQSTDFEEIIENSNTSPDYFEDFRIEMIEIANRYLQTRIFNKTSEVNGIMQKVIKTLQQVLENIDTLFILSCIKKQDQDTFKHSIHVFLLSVATGYLLQFDEEKMLKLATGAILHDTGKLMIARDILVKPAKLTNEEMSEMQKHTFYGYEILTHCANIDQDSAFIALYHHERFDGSGYPMQLKGRRIHEAAKIVAIADVYDALTSDRIYRKGLFPGKVMEHISDMCPHHFDIQILREFMKLTSVYPIGAEVILNTNKKAKVIESNMVFPSRPKVEVEEQDQSVMIDLCSNEDLYIVGVFDQRLQ